MVLLEHIHNNVPPTLSSWVWYFYFLLEEVSALGVVGGGGEGGGGEGGHYRCYVVPMAAFRYECLLCRAAVAAAYFTVPSSGIMIISLFYHTRVCLVLALSIGKEGGGGGLELLTTC